MSTAAIEAIAGQAREVAFRPRDRLLPLGQAPARLLIVTAGLAKLVGVSLHGHERILSIYRTHDMVGPTVLMDGIATEHEVEAMTHVSALSISRRDLLIVGRSHPSLILALAREVSRQIVRMTDRLMAASSTDVPIRLSSFLLEFADADAVDADGFVPLIHRVTHESMAQVIGASRPHTSTVLRDLEEHGAVRRRVGGLLVLPARLRAIVDSGGPATRQNA